MFESIHSFFCFFVDRQHLFWIFGMVAMGEYSNGCICQKKGEDLSINEVGRSIILSTTGTGAAVTGVMTQMQNDDDESAARNNYHPE